MFDYTQPDFWIFIFSVIGGTAYSIYYFIKKKKAEPFFELTMLLVNSLKDKKISGEEYLLITAKVKEILDFAVTDPVLPEAVIEDPPAPEPPLVPE